VPVSEVVLLGLCIMCYIVDYVLFRSTPFAAGCFWYPVVVGVVVVIGVVVRGCARVSSSVVRLCVVGVVVARVSMEEGLYVFIPAFVWPAIFSGCLSFVVCRGVPCDDGA